MYLNVYIFTCLWINGYIILKLPKVDHFFFIILYDYNNILNSSSVCKWLKNDHKRIRLNRRKEFKFKLAVDLVSSQDRSWPHNFQTRTSIYKTSFINCNSFQLLRRDNILNPDFRFPRIKSQLFTRK